MPLVAFLAQGRVGLMESAPAAALDRLPPFVGELGPAFATDRTAGLTLEVVPYPTLHRLVVLLLADHLAFGGDVPLLAAVAQVRVGVLRDSPVRRTGGASASRCRGWNHPSPFITNTIAVTARAARATSTIPATRDRIATAAAPARSSLASSGNWVAPAGLGGSAGASGTAAVPVR
ncbi:hypothetical protein, partial [Streptomyces sp. NPDC056540]|uniref:hypothetical protein n=1 Tax=Streptomyces sp. NPDC056540 TaxID=3345859 RepID=UPI0036874431